MNYSPLLQKLREVIKPGCGDRQRTYRFAWKIKKSYEKEYQFSKEYDAVE
jgi:hypothetical protein